MVTVLISNTGKDELISRKETLAKKLEHCTQEVAECEKQLEAKERELNLVRILLADYSLLVDCSEGMNLLEDPTA